MKLKVLSVEPMSFKDRVTGADVQMWRCYVLLDSGAVASITSRVSRKNGDEIIIRLVAGKDGKLAIRVSE